MKEVRYRCANRPHPQSLKHHRQSIGHHGRESQPHCVSANPEAADPNPASLDVLIVGGGVCGTALLFELARYTDLGRKAMTGYKQVLMFSFLTG